MTKQIEKQRQYLEYITNQMINYAQLNFDDKLDIINDNEIDELLPGLAVGVNILGEELQHKVKELKTLNEELKNRTNFIKSITDAVPEVIFVHNTISNTLTYLNKCTSDDLLLPCPVIKLNLPATCTHCKISKTIYATQKTLEIETLEKNEIRIVLPDKKVRWYKTTTNDFEKNQLGKTISTLQTLSDITLLKERELQLLASEKTISTSLKEKELLLQEVHHRVKNNLQIISGLLNMQMNRANSPALTEQLQEIQSRIHSISLIHEGLYRTENFSYVDFSGYCKKLCTSLTTLYDYNNNVEVIYNLEPGIHLSIDKATPLGLLINETMCNCYKHGFKSNGGNIWVNLSSNQSNYLLEIKDNGISKDKTEDESRTNDSLGNKLIHGLAMQLEAELEIKTEEGYSVKLIIPKTSRY